MKARRKRKRVQAWQTRPKRVVGCSWCNQTSVWRCPTKGCHKDMCFQHAVHHNHRIKATGRKPVYFFPNGSHCEFMRYGC